MRGSELVPLAAAMMLTPTPPEMACGPRAIVERQLTQDYGERARVVGLTAAGLMMQLFQSADGATWTIVLTRPDGLSCLAAHGTAIEHRPGGSEDEGPDA